MQNPCVICCEEVQSSSVQLPCGHKFHGQCIADWLWINQSCPLCRLQPNTETITQNSDDDEDFDDSFNDSLNDLYEQHRARGRKIANILRRKHLTVRATKTRNHLLIAKAHVKRCRTELSIFKKAVNANDKQRKEEETKLKHAFTRNLRDIRLKYNNSSKDIYNCVRACTSELRTSNTRIRKLEDKLIGIVK